MDKTQLLATFASRDGIDDIIKQIQEVYTLAFDVVYILDNVDDENQVIITYNIKLNSANAVSSTSVVQSTISVHRKKQTNTIYTINALNKLIMEKNDGILDTSYRVEWEELSNMVLVTAYNKLKKINTKIAEIRHLTN